MQTANVGYKAMKATITLLVLTVLGAGQAQTGKLASPSADHERLVGAWRLVSLGEVGADGKLSSVSGLKGTLVYTNDGHMSVQLMYPDSSVTNEYVLNGYEASFGSYDVNEAEHTVTHHVQGSVTRGLVGKDLTRAYKLEGKRLIIHSTRPDEHWQVTWEHE